MADDLKTLTDDQLIAALNRLTSESSERHGLNPRDLRCPKCGGIDLKVNASIWMEPDLAGKDHYLLVYADSEPEWFGDSRCYCRACDETGFVYQFIRRSPAKAEAA